MVRFLEQHGYDVRYTTNNAVAEGETTLLNYQTFLDAGHDEYWSAAERQKLEAAIAKGINVAFFGANDIYWQIRTIPDSSNRPDRIIVIYKDIHPPYLDPEHGTPTDTVRWRDPGVRDPEDKILKAMFGFDNVTRLGSNNGSLLQNLVVTDTSSWVFAGSGLKNGDTIKEILGTEVDTIYRDGSITANDTITIIGQSPYISTGGEHWVGFAVLDQLKSTHNWIFDAGTMYWPEALSNFACHSQPLCPPESPALERITQNILDRMTNSSS